MPLPWRVELTPHAVRTFKKLERPIKVRIVEDLGGRVSELSSGAPLTSVTANVKKLVGTAPEEWRLRVGDHRVRFRPEFHDAEPAPGQESREDVQQEGVIVVTRIGHRRDIYRD